MIIFQNSLLKTVNTYFSYGFFSLEMIINWSVLEYKQSKKNNAKFSSEEKTHIKSTINQSKHMITQKIYILFRFLQRLLCVCVLKAANTTFFCCSCGVNVFISIEQWHIVLWFTRERKNIQIEFFLLLKSVCLLNTIQYFRIVSDW